jgi:hypothetical protein
MATLLFPSMVRDEVLVQHEGLRARLREMAEEIAASDLDPGIRDERLRSLGRDLCERFDAHMRFEEEALVPVLAALDSWGPERVRDVHVAHARQRRKLQLLWTRLEAGEEDVELALADLAEDMVSDMEAEEGSCLAEAQMAMGLLERF